MSSISSDSARLTVDQDAMLRAIWDVLLQTGDWPAFQYLDSPSSGATGREGREIYFELGELGLIRPALRRDQEALLREDMKVSLSLSGLGQVPVASSDVEHLLASVRYIAQRAVGFSPPDPTVAATLEILSSEVAAAIGVKIGDPALVRLGRLLQETSALWSGFGGAGADGWRLTVNISRARRYANVHTLDDYLQVEQGAAASSVTTPERHASSATEAPPAQPEAPGQAAGSSRAGPLRFGRSVVADLPTSVDLLNYKPLVNALHGLLNDSSTVLPLSIAVAAPWGAGKSSVMEQLEVALQTRPGTGASRIWTTVRFEAWKYERSERLWAALAKAVYSQPQQQMSRARRLSFRVRLEWHRRGPLGTLLLVAWPAVVAAALAFAAIKVDFSSAGAIGTVLAGATVTLAAVSRYGHSAANPFKAAIDRHARRPDYESQLGFTAEADRDIGVLMRLLAPDDEHGLAIFVDDLDRCSSTHLVEVVEAMNQIFNSDREHRSAFILGLDRDIVATNINVAYAGTVAELSKDGQDELGRRFGYEFLAKLVQLSISIPEPTAAALQKLLASITGNAAPDEGSAAGGDSLQPAVQEEVKRVQEEIQASAGGSLADVSGAAAQVADAPQEVVVEAERRVVAGRLEDSPEVAAAERAAVPFLERNPRQLKRFHNAFRLQLYVANEDADVPFDFTEAELVALTKWVVVRLRWPDLGNTIARDPALLLVIEAEANGETQDLAAGLLSGSDRMVQGNGWLALPGVRVVMHEEDRSRRMSAIELKAFLRVA
jgi:KAP family P-loop domain